MIFRAHRNYPYYLRPKKIEVNKEKEELENSLNIKILDAILEDDEEQFSQLLSDNVQDISKSNQKFNITNYKIPNILKGSPSYASLCAFFSAENCFSILSLLLPGGTASEEMKKVDLFKRSPVHFACIGGSLKILRELDQAMFDLNAKDECGYLPSHYASMAGHFDVVKYLWAKGADLTSPSFEDKMTPLQVACFYGNLDIVTFLCETVIPNQMKKSENCSDNFLRDFLIIGRQPTPLHYACRGGHDNIVNYLLSKPELVSLQINALDKNSRNPLLCACHNGSLSCVKAILNGAGSKIKLDMKGRKHLPLVDAAAGGYLDIVNFLVKQKNIKIQQETSENMSALHAAVLSDHLNVVKLLIQNGAAKGLPKDKIAHIFFSAIHNESLDLISYLNSVLEIPYSEKYKVEKITARTSYRYRRAVEENESKNLSYGDFYMQQACLFENKDLVLFLLDQKCSLDFVDVSKILNEKSFSFIEFLIEKGFDPSCSKNPSITPPIVKLISIGNISLIEKFLSYGAVLNKEIISNYKCLLISLEYENYDVFMYLMNYKPEIEQEDATFLFRTVFNNFICRYKLHPLNNYYLNVMEMLLQNFQIDLNSPYRIQFTSSTFISYAAAEKNITLLKLFEKYKANFKDCKLRFESMITDDYIPIYAFLRDNGCKFENRILDNNISFHSFYSANKNNVHLCPIHKIFTCLLNTSLSIDVIVFMLDFSTPKQILNTEYHGSNLIDLFIDRNRYDAIIKAFTLVNGIFYPLCKNVQYFNGWIAASKNAALYNIVFNSGLRIVKGDEEIEYDNSDSMDDYDEFDFI